jgi:DNA-binding GntR family transcriptional regulator
MDELVAGPDGAPSRFFALDSELHHSIAEATRSPLLVAAVDDVRAQLFTPIGGIFLALHPTANELHHELVDAVEARDAAAAEATMREPIALTRDAMYELAGGR